MIQSKSLQDLSVEVAQSYKPDSTGDTHWSTSGLIDFQAPFNRFMLDKALPLITEGADEQIGRGRSQHIDRNTAAILLDWNLRRLSQARAVTDLRIGEFLVDFRKKHPEKLGYVHLPDYTREELGIPWRSASLLVSNWTALSGLPFLKQAHREGKISKSKLRWLLRVVTPQNEEAWIEKASKLSVRALEDDVRAEETRRNGEAAGGAESSCAEEADGKCVPVLGRSGPGAEEERSGYLMSLETTPERAAAWDFALEHFRGHEGGNFSTAFFIEALLAEFCSAIPLPSGDVLPDKVISPPLSGGAHCRRITGTEDDDFFSSNANGKELDEEREKWRALRRDLEDVTKMWEFLSWTPVTVETPVEWDDSPEDARAVSDMLKKLVVMRQSVGFYMGRLLRSVENLHLHADMHFVSFNHYVVERLGISMRTARNLIKLVRAFLSLPLIEKAFRDGVLTQERALLLLKVAVRKTEKEWLKYGIEVPVLDLECEVRRLSRLIEGDRNLLEKNDVRPGFEPSVEMKKLSESNSDCYSKSSQALDAASDVSKENSCASGKMSATEKLPDENEMNSSEEIVSEEVVSEEAVSKKAVSEAESEMSPASENATGSGTNPGSDSVHSNDSNPGSCFDSNPSSGIGAGSGHGTGSATIRFFVPDDLIPLWNYAFMRYLELATGNIPTQEVTSSPEKDDGSNFSGNINTSDPNKTSSHTENESLLLEGFLFSLLCHYLENEHICQKKKRRLSRHKVIERDGLKCMIPGCSSRARLNDHHIKYRSHGGGDELPNNTSACNAHHKHCIHDNHYITVSGTAPDNLTIAMGVECGRAPFALFINGRRTATGSV